MRTKTPLHAIKWAPTRDGKFCNVCRKPVHYDGALHIHIHDDPGAASCGGKR